MIGNTAHTEISCPHCGKENSISPIELIRVTTFADENGTQLATVNDNGKCWSCRKRFVVSIKLSVFVISE